MKIVFQIEKEISQIIITPENSRDKACIALCISEKNNIKLKPTTTDAIVFEFNTIRPIEMEQTQKDCNR